MHSIKKSRQSFHTDVSQGFTLIEVLIVVAIIGILGAIAYPQYGKFVEKSRRADAHLALLQEVQNFERCKASNFSFTGCTLSQTKSAEGFYDLTVSSDATTYTITATGVGTQADDTDCKVMTINDRNTRTPADNCWPT